jgi:hypothetical protein
MAGLRDASDELTKNWSSWYAEYMVSEQNGKKLPQ